VSWGCRPEGRTLLDLTAVPLLKSLTHLPVVVAPGATPEMACAAVAAGADGLVLEPAAGCVADALDRCWSAPGASPPPWGASSPDTGSASPTRPAAPAVRPRGGSRSRRGPVPRGAAALDPHGIAGPLPGHTEPG
jgi:hypothetical protein